MGIGYYMFDLGFPQKIFTLKNNFPVLPFLSVTVQTKWRRVKDCCKTTPLLVHPHVVHLLVHLFVHLYIDLLDS